MGGDEIFPSPGPEGLEKWEMGRVEEELGGGPGVGGNANSLGCPSHSSEVGAIEGMEQRRDRT